MISKIPHVIPYQGSKRKLADQILSYINFDVENFYEPFAGSAAVTIAAAKRKLAEQYIFGDKLEVVSELWNLVLNNPDELIYRYEHVWNSQLGDPTSHYYSVREQFNMSHDPSLFLYLAARCVKNAIRFNGQGQFNQGMDKRRLGTKPEKMKNEILGAHLLLKGKAKVRKGDFSLIMRDATADDLVYMDPPWQGTSSKANPRYAFLLNLDELIASFEDLNERGVPYMVSFDGVCGDKNYGEDLPKHLKLKKILLNAGRSSQSTLLGKDSITLESLYLSESFLDKPKLKSDESKTPSKSNLQLQLVV